MNKILLIGSAFYKNGFVKNKIVPKVNIEKTTNGLRVVNCYGFDGSKLFLKEFLSHKEEILALAPIDALVLIVDFNTDESKEFLNLAQRFVCLFGYEAIKSLMLLCIQDDDKIRNGFEKFEESITKSEGYQHLKSENEQIDIPYCLWHNIRPYYNQAENFINCFKKLQKFSKPIIECSLELMERD